MKAIVPVLAWIVCIAIGIAVVLLVGDAKRSIEAENSDNGGEPMK